MEKEAEILITNMEKEAEYNHENEFPKHLNHHVEP